MQTKYDMEIKAMEARYSERLNENEESEGQMAGQILQFESTVEVLHETNDHLVSVGTAYDAAKVID